jgi:hypothetical protein
MMDMTLRELLDVVTSYYPAPYTPEEPFPSNELISYEPRCWPS